ncbi:Gfo/Idh/MocA family oxidoreductase [Xylanimonas protaetiae]|uniref:Gfo/Idh/MocA family oxidoreductase n=1 Tax=Xylanimonas protaetiae TaxID=2509457 RepID=A0A4P6F567_9MICO|nr:Gfo/Idh/MocA family oxidoreductase [Xylanimonas protaetiae]QAY70754.1 gfo/Idh/MocA family oxidoreductase [Xylanimonas protaetiae]
MALRVGLLGAGAVAQAIHLPTLARLADRVRVTQVMDVDTALAAAVAAPLGATVTGSVPELLAGGIDVAVICSPDRFHADHVEALCAAGVRGILAEKPLATSRAEAERVAAAVTASGAALVLGAMHTFDPAWLAASAAFADPGPFHVRSAIYLPANARFEDMATTMVRPAPGAPRRTSEAEALRAGVLGLAIHDLPLVRRFLPRIDRVEVAARVEPWGYVITASGPDGTVELLARTGGTWQPDWTLTVWGRQTELEVAFPPSYVHAGSAVATLQGPDGVTTWGPYAADGYLAEWEELLAVLGGARPRQPLDVLLDDLDHALTLADLAVDAVDRAWEAA